jgi:hypothetical protein
LNWRWMRRHWVDGEIGENDAWRDVGRKTGSPH